MYDVVIIGAGVTGAAAARELSRYQLKICVLEREEDVCCGTSKANSAIVHAGYDAKPGTLKARLNRRGSERMEALSKELDFPYRRNGSLVLCLSEENLPKLQELYEKGQKNGIRDLRILSREEVLELEPHVSENVTAALYAPTAAIVCPFGLTIALAENAAANGAEFFFDTEVQELKKEADIWQIQTNKGIVESRYVVNAAGVYADRFHNMVSEQKIHITARRGDYLLLDKNAGNHVTHTIFTLPDQWGKGVLVAPTVHGNLLVGPTAIDIEDKEGVNTTREGLDQVIEKSGQSVRDIPYRQVITSFAGLRAHEDGDDFLIGEVPDAPGFIDCAGIESPGLSSAPAIGEEMVQILKDKMELKEKTDFVAERKGILHPDTISEEAYTELVKAHPEYGTVICRCETITEGEIIDAIRRPVGARSLDGVKRRTRAGMGRCQGGFCSPKVMDILARERAVPLEEITKAGGQSRIIMGINKDRL